MAFLPRAMYHRPTLSLAAASVLFLLVTYALLPWLQPHTYPARAPPKSLASTQATSGLESDTGTGPVGEYKPVIHYKPDDLRPLSNRPFVPTNETFPAASQANSPLDLPPVPRWNRPPAEHVPELTPLFIGFTRNWPLLQQTIVSLITAGWPPSDIYVVENTGVMDANERGQLTLDNPFFLDHRRLREIFQVNVIVMPSLQTFAQLQNFYLFHAIRHGWPHYFWAHMDIVVQSLEDLDEHPDLTQYKSFYARAVDALRNETALARAATSDTSSDTTTSTTRKPWAVSFFQYDFVALMNTSALIELGGWDTMISYYGTDCDLYDRMRMRNYTISYYNAGQIYDTGESLDDLRVLYREVDADLNSAAPTTTRGLNSPTYHTLQATFKEMTRRKEDPDWDDRNRWQIAQRGGRGEPWYRDPDGFAAGLKIQIQAGLDVLEEKWHSKRHCDIIGDGLKAEDEWKVQYLG